MIPNLHDNAAHTARGQRRNIKHFMAQLQASSGSDDVSDGEGREVGGGGGAGGGLEPRLPAALAPVGGEEEAGQQPAHQPEHMGHHADGAGPGPGRGQGQHQVHLGTVSLELETNVHSKVRNHGEGLN